MKRDDELFGIAKVLSVYSSAEIEPQHFDTLEQFLDEEITVQLPSKTIEIPGVGDKGFVIINLPGHPAHIPLREIIKKAAIPAAKAILKFEPQEVGWSVLETLKDLVEKASWLSRDQFAICRAVLLKMEEKRYKVLSEKGASVQEIKDTMRAQMEEPPADLEEQVRILTGKEVLRVEPSGEETFYLVVQ